jgi:hypothetical protein
MFSIWMSVVNSWAVKPYASTLTPGNDFTLNRYTRELRKYFVFGIRRSIIIMILPCVSALRNQILITRFFRSSPFQWNTRTNHLIHLQNVEEKRAFRVLSFFHFLYISLAVLVQWLLIGESVETCLLSLAFTAILVASAVMKFMLIKQPKQIISLINGLISFENKA